MNEPEMPEDVKLRIEEWQRQYKLAGIWTTYIRVFMHGRLWVVPSKLIHPGWAYKAS